MRESKFSVPVRTVQTVVLVRDLITNGAALFKRMMAEESQDVPEPLRAVNVTVRHVAMATQLFEQINAYLDSPPKTPFEDVVKFSNDDILGIIGLSFVSTATASVIDKQEGQQHGDRV